MDPRHLGSGKPCCYSRKVLSICSSQRVSRAQVLPSFSVLSQGTLFRGLTIKPPQYHCSALSDPGPTLPKVLESMAAFLSRSSQQKPYPVLSRASSKNGKQICPCAKCGWSVVVTHYTKWESTWVICGSSRKDTLITDVPMGVRQVFCHWPSLSLNPMAEAHSSLPS